MFVLPRTAASAEAGGWHRYDFKAAHMGTVWTITCYGRDLSKASNAVAAAFAKVKELDSSMSDYDPESELNRLMKEANGGVQRVSPEMAKVLREALEVSRQTEGIFDVTAGPLIQLWRRARRQRELPEPARIREAQSLTGYTNLMVHPNQPEVRLLKPAMRIDLGGIGKGFAADAALRILNKQGIKRASVAASGDIAIGDPPPGTRGWPVQVGDPTGTNQVAGLRLLLRNAGVSTSGDVEQRVEINGVRYSHIVDARTGFGLTGSLQATVIADNATLSDAWATAVCILGREQGLRKVDRNRRMSALVVTKESDGLKLQTSARFQKHVR